MPKMMSPTLLAAVVAGLLCSGCINSHHAAINDPAIAVPASPIVVTEAPPTVRVEQIGDAPDAAHVWIPGYWMRGNGNWIWVPGHWEAKPGPNLSWRPGHWDKAADGKGWVWTPGRWE